jgi:hypothetical protein
MDQPDPIDAATLDRYLDRALFPTDREMILAMAVRASAPPTVLDRLRKLPSRMTFDTIEAVLRELGVEPPPDS